MMETKLKRLEEIIRGYGQMLVAFSGGVDSTFLLAFAHKVFGDDRVAALTATGPMFADDEQEYAAFVCDRLGISQKQISAEHVVNMVKRNPVDRCYHCKREIFSLFKERADMVGSVLADGTNADDMNDYRPGFKAVRELGVASPLLEAGLTKAEIREALRNLAIEMNLGDIWSRPAFACLASRIPYGETITEQKLEAIYRAELLLKDKGFTQVRVRCHEIAGNVSGNTAKFMARIEVLPEEAKEILNLVTLEQEIKELGFMFVTLDLGGYRKGNMNMLSDAQPPKPDRIEVTEEVRRGKASNVNREDVLEEIDRFLRETREKKYTFKDFVDIIERLRMPDGCPWDRKQTHESLKKHLVEEANEALDAIDERDYNHLCEELGDVLLQIVLHAQIGKEMGEFTIDDVVQSVSEKMIRRHPHVFGNIDIAGVDEGLDIWEEIKKREKMNSQ